MYETDIVIRLKKTRDPLMAEAAREITALRKLLSQALDALPDYSDGRNDKLCNAIEKILSRGVTSATPIAAHPPAPRTRPLPRRTPKADS
jgi:hypothetical protein